MTVEEMRPVRRAPPPALFILFGLHVCEKRGGKKQRAAHASRPQPDLLGLGLAGLARPDKDKSLAFALLDQRAIERLG
jgi:hypothetical protein